jgi:nucleotide-binding universal stress UspA family protein
MSKGGIMFKNVIWATDGSENAERALPTAVELVKDGGGKLFVVHANEIFGGRAAGAPVYADEDDRRAQLRAEVDDLVTAGIDAELQIVSGMQSDPADLIAKKALELGADVIVVGTRGHGRVAGALLGSVTQRLLHVASCPVLAVPVKAGAVAEGVPTGAR